MPPFAILALLLAINMFNYIDRQILYSLLPLISRDLHLSDTQAGSLASAFMIVYMFAALPVAWLSGRGRKNAWMAGSVAVWSLATGAASLAVNYASLICSRAIVGAGEACYAALSPAILADHCSANARSSIMAYYNMAIPVGSAIGFAAGGILGMAFGWRTAMLAVGVPGLLLSALCLRLPQEPLRQSIPSPLNAYRTVWKVTSFRQICYSGAGLSFALGGIAVWMPTFYQRNWGLGLDKAGLIFGATTVAAGVFGSLTGGWLADYLRPRLRSSDLFISGWGLILSLPCAIASILSPTLASSVVLLFAAEFFAFLNMGPLNSAIISITTPQDRSLAFAANIFFIHLLGDALSPTLIGWGSDTIGIIPTMLCSCLPLGIAGAICLRSQNNFLNDRISIAS